MAENENEDDPCGKPLSVLFEQHRVQLSELRARIHARDASLLLPSHTDSWLLRFLLHSSVDKATDRIIDMLIWRRENEVDSIATKVKELKGDFMKFPHYDKINSNIPMELMFGYTSDGCPFAVERWGQAEPISLLETVRADEYLEFCLYKFEFMRMKLEEMEEDTGKFLKWCAVMDVTGANMKQCNKPFVDMLRKAAKTTELHYRELIGKVYVVNANRVFTFLWGIVKNFLPARTLNKITITRDPMKALTGQIPDSSIPGYLGGSGPDRCPPHLRCLTKALQVSSVPAISIQAPSSDSLSSSPLQQPQTATTPPPSPGMPDQGAKAMIKSFENALKKLPRLSIADSGMMERMRSSSMGLGMGMGAGADERVPSPREQRLRHLASFKPLLSVLNMDASNRRAFSNPLHDSGVEAVLKESDSDKDPVVSPPVLQSGWLQKYNWVRKRWTRRFFRLYRGELAYYRKEKHARPIRVLSLYGYSAHEGGTEGLSHPPSGHVFCLRDTKAAKAVVVVLLQAPSRQVILEWLAALDANCQYISSAARQYLSAVVVDECTDSDHESVLDDSEVIDLKKARRASIHKMNAAVGGPRPSFNTNDVASSSRDQTTDQTADQNTDMAVAEAHKRKGSSRSSISSAEDHHNHSSGSRSSDNANEREDAMHITVHAPGCGTDGVVEADDVVPPRSPQHRHVDVSWAPSTPTTSLPCPSNTSPTSLTPSSTTSKSSRHADSHSAQSSPTVAKVGSNVGMPSFSFEMPLPRSRSKLFFFTGKSKSSGPSSSSTNNSSGSDITSVSERVDIIEVPTKATKHKGSKVAAAPHTKEVVNTSADDQNVLLGKIVLDPHRWEKQNLLSLTTRLCV